MARDFFDGLGDSISRKTRDLGKMAGQIYETQKIRSKVSSEEHMIAKLKADIGNYIYEKYQNGEEVEDALRGFCEEIQQHLEIIEGYRDTAAELKGQKICRSCGNSVDRSVSYCPYCGSPCPTPEPKEEPVAEPEEEPVAEPEEEPAAEPEEYAAPEASAAPETDFVPEPELVPEAQTGFAPEYEEAPEQTAEAQEEPAAGETQETYAPERETSETEN
mgnify:FL=1